jgi:hypothetical protein
VIIGIDATPGASLLAAARDPLDQRNLIGFTVWSSVVHGGRMAAQANTHPRHRGHLPGDVPAPLAAAAVPGRLMPRRAAGPARVDGGASRAASRGRDRDYAWSGVARRAA